tara:strand:- start:214 stop:417 length:204 start_codon:yes stop_codon:yes gene_type:complete
MESLPISNNAKQVIANQKYRNKNREKYNEYQRNYLKKKYQEDPEFKRRLKASQTKYYEKRKAQKLTK